MQKFYMEYRLSVGYAKTDPVAPDPSFSTRQEWEAVKSTKMDVCARICRYYLHYDDVADVTFEEGQPVFGPTRQYDADKGDKRTRKILIYSEFPSLTGLLRKVCVQSIALECRL